MTLVAHTNQLYCFSKN